MSDNLIVSFYMYELFKSKYLEEIKDVETDQDVISDNLDKIKLLYMFNEDLPKGDYLETIKKFGTEVKVNGYNYNLNKIAAIISSLSNRKVSYSNLTIINHEVIDNKKSLIVFNSIDCKTYKLNINANNSTVIIPKKFKAYGVNMLCVDEVEHVNIEDEFLMSSVWEIMNKNGGYITDRNKLYLFEKYIGKKFIRKWDKENMLVSVLVEDFYEYDDFFYNDFSNNEFMDGDDF